MKISVDVQLKKKNPLIKIWNLLIIKKKNPEKNNNQNTECVAYSYRSSSLENEETIGMVKHLTKKGLYSKLILKEFLILRAFWIFGFYLTETISEQLNR